MTGPRLDSFQKALQRFKNTLPPDLVDEFSVCTLHDVRDICRDIQDTHGREGKLRHMRRLSAFIEAMEQFGKVIEMFANVNEIVCFIWGPIKFLLGITRTHMDSFDKLLDVYDKIGNAIPGLLRYQSAFEKHPPLATVLEDYYADILGFHQAALSVFRRPRWKELFHSTWKTFDSKFGPILQSMSKRRELLESEKGSATLYEIQKLREDILDIYATQKRQNAQESVEKHRREVSYIREKLEAPNYRIDQEMSTEDRHGHSSGTWIFEDPTFFSWSDHDTPGHSALYVNGMPGAGKTTLMSAVIEKLLDSKCSKGEKYLVAYFYFKQSQPNKESHNSLLRALLLQLVERDAAISNHVFEETSSIEGVNLRSTKTLEGLVKTTLESYRISYIVLDGLDECAPNEAEKSVKWFLSLLNGGIAETDKILRVLFCGQRDGTLDKLLANQPSVCLESSRHVEDIRQYCQDFCRRIREKFDIPPAMEEDIILKVTNGAQGMFLYARVVLENLCKQTRLSRLRQELEPGTFPQGIEKAYERVAIRIFEMSSMAEREDAKKILGWVICAKRLLRWREIQSLFCIDPVKGNVDYEERRLRVTCKELCGSLVDVHHAANKTSPEDIIKIVHETAREYLVRRKWLNPSVEHARLAIFCSRYLTSRPFTYGIDKDDIVTYAVEGYYALQDYAVQYWFDHFRECMELIAKSDPKLYQEAMSVAKVFLVSYGLPSKVRKLPDVEGHDEVATTLADLPRDGCERNAYFNIEHRTTCIRNAIESLDWLALHPKAQKAFTNLLGNTPPYKCAKPWCESFTVGFEKAKDRKQHTHGHDRPFRCPIESCFAFQLGYDTSTKLDQHQKKHHPSPNDDEIMFPKKFTKKAANIWMAVTVSDLATITSLLDSGVNVNRRRKSDEAETLLYLAVKSGHFEVCEMLLKRGANINTVQRGSSRTALHAAVVAGNLDIVHLLVSQEGCQIDETDSSGRSPFCEACALGQLDIVKLLLKAGKIRTTLRPQQHPECCSNKSYHSALMPLGYACNEGHFAVVQYLLEQGQSNLVDITMLTQAARYGHGDIVDLLRSVLAERGSKLSQSSLSSGMTFIHVPAPFTTKKSGYSVAFNPAIPPTFDVELAHTLQLEGSVRCLQFSPDGKWLAVGSRSWVLIFDVVTGKCLYVLEEHDALDVAHAICFSPDGKHLATAGWFIRIWDITARTIINELPDQGSLGRSICFASDGRTIAFVSDNGTAGLWDPYASSSTTPAIYTHITAGTEYAISPDTKFVATDVASNCHMWNIHTNRLIRSFSNGCRILSIRFSPNARDLITGHIDGAIKAWDLGVLGETALQGPRGAEGFKTFKGHETSVCNIALTSDSQWLFSRSRDCEVRLWDYSTGETLFIIQEDKVEDWPIVDLPIAVSPTGDYFATAAPGEQGVQVRSRIRI
ncbi:WD40 repeat-like protein [Xylaria telfairii]|nr:WD40 repeat-like protein [Xylaria telfairii]